MATLLASGIRRSYLQDGPPPWYHCCGEYAQLYYLAAPVLLKVRRPTSILTRKKMLPQWSGTAHFIPKEPLQPEVGMLLIRPNHCNSIDPLPDLLKRVIEFAESREEVQAHEYDDQYPNIGE